MAHGEQHVALSRAARVDERGDGRGDGRPPAHAPLGGRFELGVGSEGEVLRGRLDGHEEPLHRRLLGVALVLGELRVEDGHVLGEPLHRVLVEADVLGDGEGEPLRLEVHDVGLARRGIEALVEGLPEREAVAVGEVDVHALEEELVALEGGVQRCPGSVAASAAELLHLSALDAGGVVAAVVPAHVRAHAEVGEAGPGGVALGREDVHEHASEGPPLLARAHGERCASSLQHRVGERHQLDVEVVVRDPSVGSTLGNSM